MHSTEAQVRKLVAEVEEKQRMNRKLVEAGRTVHEADQQRIKELTIELQRAREAAAIQVKVALHAGAALLKQKYGWTDDGLAEWLQQVDELIRTRSAEFMEFWEQREDALQAAEAGNE